MASIGLPLYCGEYRASGPCYFPWQRYHISGSHFSLGGDGHTCSTPREGALCLRWRGYHYRYLKWRSHCTLFKVAMLPRSLFKVEEPGKVEKERNGSEETVRWEMLRKRARARCSIIQSQAERRDRGQTENSWLLFEGFDMFLYDLTRKSKSRQL